MYVCNEMQCNVIHDRNASDNVELGLSPPPFFLGLGVYEYRKKEKSPGYIAKGKKIEQNSPGWMGCKSNGSGTREGSSERVRVRDRQKTQPTLADLGPFFSRSRSRTPPKRRQPNSPGPRHATTRHGHAPARERKKHRITLRQWLTFCPSKVMVPAQRRRSASPVLASARPWKTMLVPSASSLAWPGPYAPTLSSLLSSVPRLS